MSSPQLESDVSIIAPEERNKLGNLKDEMFLRAIIVANIMQLTPNIPVQISRIAELSFASENEVKNQLDKLLKINPEYGDYLRKEEIFIRRINADGMNDPLISTEQYLSESTDGKFQQCLDCGTMQSVLMRLCSNCYKELEYCTICKRGYAKGDQMSICPHCSEMFHKDHITAYIRENGNCPNCFEQLTTDLII